MVGIVSIVSIVGHDECVVLDVLCEDELVVGSVNRVAVVDDGDVVGGNVVDLGESDW